MKVLYFSFLCSTGAWTQGLLILAMEAFPTWAMTLARPFCIIIFRIEPCLFAQDRSWTSVLLLMPPRQVRIQACITTPSLLVEMEVSLSFFFFLGWSRTVLLMTYVSQVVGITDVSCHTQPWKSFIFKICTKVLMGKMIWRQEFVLK
jgi:hypothetical protein